jgi:hypothetical protein
MLRQKRITFSSARTLLPMLGISRALDLHTRALRVECAKCDRKGRYHVLKLIEKYGRKGNMMKWREMLSADCLKRCAHSMHDRCDLVCPDLPKVQGARLHQ